jgi:hypothetical protein
MSDIIERLKSIYKDKYDYSNVIYVNENVPICLKCKIHGDFFESPSNLIYYRQGCPKCYKNQSSGEQEVRKILEEYDIHFEQEKNLPGLFYKGPLYLDFFLKDENTAIEYQGLQHMKPIDFFGGKEAFKEQQIRDNIKREYCKANNIHLIEIPFYEDTYSCLQDLIETTQDSDALSEDF